MFTKFYYTIRPIIPRKYQIRLRQFLIKRKVLKYKDVWPINKSSCKKPENWKGWPDNKQFALVLMHDVDTQKGHDNCIKLMELEQELGFRSTFYFVPERYNISEKLIQTLKKNGFGVGVHGLKHDGKLFKSKKMFKERAVHINKYLKKWETKGFSSPSMHHNFDWMSELNIDYATSSFDTDPFEPQPDGVSTIFPFIVKNNDNHSYVELPCTLPQDSTLFILMKEKNIDIWKKKTDWIAGYGGMALLNTHPDYMSFSESIKNCEEYPIQFYIDFLTYANSKFEQKYFLQLAKETAIYLKKD